MPVADKYLHLARDPELRHRFGNLYEVKERRVIVLPIRCELGFHDIVSGQPLELWFRKPGSKYAKRKIAYVCKKHAKPPK